MNLEELKNSITKDSQIDSTELGIESLKIPQIHSKYLNQLTDLKLLLTKYQHDFAILRLRKWKIYTGKASEEELADWKEDPFELDILKTDVDKFMDADPKLIELKSKISVTDIKIKMVEEFLKALNNRNFAIKSAIEWNKMMNGIV
jgi:ferredoxin-fold anticodon binding domain-containing protein